MLGKSYIQGGCSQNQSQLFNTFIMRKVGKTKITTLLAPKLVGDSNGCWKLQPLSWSLQIVFEKKGEG